MAKVKSSSSKSAVKAPLKKKKEGKKKPIVLKKDKKKKEKKATKEKAVISKAAATKKKQKKVMVAKKSKKATPAASLKKTSGTTAKASKKLSTDAAFSGDVTFHALGRWSLDRLDRKTYTRKGFKPMREEQIQRLKEVEAAAGSELEEIEEVSCGCIVVNLDKKGVARMLVITSLKGVSSGYCSLPKGHINPGETEIDCACRETNEETGTRLTPKNITLDSDQQPISLWKGHSFVDKLHRDHWVNHANYPDESKRPFVLSHKKVHFFLASVPIQTLKKTVGEDAKNIAEWLEVKTALERLPFEDDRALIRTFMERGSIKI